MDEKDAAAPSGVSPIKVRNETKKKVKFGAALINTSQQEFVDRAVDALLEKKGVLQIYKAENDSS
jgi:hypothetical protein